MDIQYQEITVNVLAHLAICPQCNFMFYVDHKYYKEGKPYFCPLCFEGVNITTIQANIISHHEYLYKMRQKREKSRVFSSPFENVEK